ncbi:MAG: hypothetical protein ACI4JK_07925 [Oscillospiraceae bacterium]
MTILTKYNDKEITEEQLEALAASMLAQMIEYYKNNHDEQAGDEKVA